MRPLNADCPLSGRSSSKSKLSEDPSFPRTACPCLAAMFRRYKLISISEFPSCHGFKLRPVLHRYPLCCNPLNSGVGPLGPASICENHDPKCGLRAGIDKAMSVPPISEVSIASMGSYAQLPSVRHWPTTTRYTRTEEMASTLSLQDGDSDFVDSKTANTN